MDFCPAFWQWLEIANQNGIVLSVQEVADELEDEELVEWKSEAGKNLFMPTDPAIGDTLHKISDWVQSKPYLESAAQEFFSNADPYLIAHAKIIGAIVVTHEISAPHSKKDIKIPDVCNEFRIECIDPFEMLRREKPRFILENQQP